MLFHAFIACRPNWLIPKLPQWSLANWLFLRKPVKNKKNIDLPGGQTNDSFDDKSTTVTVVSFSSRCELDAKAGPRPLPEYVYLITLVKFHPTNPDRLATGGADGLINVFDVSQESEDDALLTALNPGVSSVRSLTWFQRKNDTEALAAISDDEELVRFLVAKLQFVVFDDIIPSMYLV